MGRNRFASIVFFLILIASCDTGIGIISVREVTEGEALAALAVAETKVDSPYEWGENGPDAFDCSGLIVWAYQQILGQRDIFTVEGASLGDVSIETIYRSCSRPLDEAEVVKGDVVFITDDPAGITHGGLVMEVKADTVVFLNASSYYGKVLVDEWPVDTAVRDQRIAGYGRLVVSIKK